MNTRQTIAEWLNARGISAAQLVELTGLDQKVIEAIAAGRYTTSPKQRDRIASALGVSADEIAWGNAVDVDHMYGHGPQFGRSP